MAPLSSFSAFLQPASAWSKKGLLVFFGTSAKVYGSRGARAAGRAASNAPAATAPVNISFNIAFPP